MNPIVVRMTFPGHLIVPVLRANRQYCDTCAKSDTYNPEELPQILLKCTKGGTAKGSRRFTQFLLFIIFIV